MGPNVVADVSIRKRIIRRAGSEKRLMVVDRAISMANPSNTDCLEGIAKKKNSLLYEEPAKEVPVLSSTYNIRAGRIPGLVREIKCPQLIRTADRSHGNNTG